MIDETVTQDPCNIVIFHLHPDNVGLDLSSFLAK